MDSFNRSQSGALVTISLYGELDSASVGDVHTVAQLALDAHNVTPIDVDLAPVTFMDSTALGALVGLRNDANRSAVRLVLRNVPPQVRQQLTITGLDEVFAIDDHTGTREAHGQ